MTERRPEFTGLLTLESVDRDIFRGACHAGAPMRAFGGQVAAQAQVAAGRTVEDDRRIHSLHGYFLRPGRTDASIVYLVERIRDGRSFTTRRVSAVQDGETIFTMSASFQRPRHSDETHQVHAPTVAGPLESHQLWGPIDDAPEFRPFQLIDIRWPAGPGGDPAIAPAAAEAPVADMAAAGAADGMPRLNVWVRVGQPLPDDPLLHVCALTYLSDLTLARTSSLPYDALPGKLDIVSLDHAMWFHRPFRADEWFLYDCTSPSASNARGLATGNLFTRDGLLVATVVQEGLLRVLP